MKQKYYLIDTENVGDRWTSYIQDLHEEEILVVFYSKNHSKLLQEVYLEQRYNQQIRWIECITGNNALDYQLIGVLSYLIATHTDASYAIFSNDNDYQNIIEFWEKRNIRINRVGFSPDKKKPKKDHPKGVSNTATDVPDNLPKERQQPEEYQDAPFPRITADTDNEQSDNEKPDNKPSDNEKPDNNQSDNEYTNNEQLLKIAKAVPPKHLYP